MIASLLNRLDSWWVSGPDVIADMVLIGLYAWADKMDKWAEQAIFFDVFYGILLISFLVFWAIMFIRGPKERSGK